MTARDCARVAARIAAENLMSLEECRKAQVMVKVVADLLKNEHWLQLCGMAEAIATAHGGRETLNVLGRFMRSAADEYVEDEDTAHKMRETGERLLQIYRGEAAPGGFARGSAAVFGAIAKARILSAGLGGLFGQKAGRAQQAPAPVASAQFAPAAHLLLLEKEAVLQAKIRSPLKQC